MHVVQPTKSTNFDGAWRVVDTDDLMAAVAKPQKEATCAASHLEYFPPDVIHCISLNLPPRIELGKVERRPRAEVEIAVISFDYLETAAVAEVID